MPGKKKSYGKKRKYTKKKMVIPRNPGRLHCTGVCPDVMSVQLHYSRNGSLTGASPQSRVFRGNSCFDPDFTGVGSQPLGFDQWSQFYRRYRVIASKIVVSSVTKSTEGTRIAVAPLNTNTVITLPTTLQESNYCKQSRTTGLSTGSSTSSVTNYISTAAIRGGPFDIVQYEADLSALISTNPTQQWYWHVMNYNVDGSITNIDTNINVDICYYVEFYDRETLSQS